MEIKELAAAIEAILFAAGYPISFGMAITTAHVQL